MYEYVVPPVWRDEKRDYGMNMEEARGYGGGKSVGDRGYGCFFLLIL